jgi:two-component system response regulator HydG
MHQTSLKDRLDAYERSLIEEALAATSGNQRQAAFRLGVLPTTLHEKLKRLGMISRPARRAEVAAEGGFEASAY